MVKTRFYLPLHTLFYGIQVVLLKNQDLLSVSESCSSSIQVWVAGKINFYWYLTYLPEKMSIAMDRALMALSLEEEEEEPFTMPDRPGFTSIEENFLSLMGRTLNPECQRMSRLITTMPRKWQKEGKVRGIALSQERFKFIFNTEHDLLDVLEKGLQTFNEWAMVLERWVENPPEDYLQYFPLWVRISHIPEEYYTIEALTTLVDMIGKVIVVAFDPLKPVTQPYIRVQVLFNVTNLLRMSSHKS